MFSNIYLAAIIVLASYATCVIFNVPASQQFYLFLFCSTCSSYCLHWALENNASTNNFRQQWSYRNKKLLVVFSIIAFIVGCVYFYYLPTNAFVLIAPLVFFTFLYTAPKINIWPFTILRKMVFAKTLYLTLALTYATIILPILLFKTLWQTHITIYCLQKGIIIFIICLLFDYRDRHIDVQQGIKSIIYKISEKQLWCLIIVLLTLAMVLGIMFIVGATQAFTLANLVHMFLPILVLLLVSKFAMQSQNIYLYYGFLDALLAIHAIGIIFL